ncbi:phosphoribosylglycinamide formyltransferase [Wenzhouxiangella sp. AB-CW3]|uniref:phosphoribosylglycinamide formyltransferase n=1 Tax=Wenzhouxiangella sp. AB-CW3 TaxID=2771012 RepID=UPI00168A855D|nr:phosphoribosylglycinamide formyltransferase [Wenzhouxiangella sp. AB-CW3]QOC21724.1 phosphoribosylglycinamide formyltransferase [Wenzhouxiangella sp. AB-CW3]
MSEQPRLVVLASGRGSNFQAILNAIKQQRLAATLGAMISDRAGAGALELAANQDVDTVCIEPRHFSGRDDYEKALMTAIDGFAPHWVVLAGFMRVLGANLVHHYLGRMINIHPSLLPRHRGLNTHRRVLEAGESDHGASVHFVTPALDSGPVIAQVRMRVAEDDTADTLADRLLPLEHRLYPATLALLLDHRVELRDEDICIDDQTIAAPLRLGRDLDDDGRLVRPGER